MSNIKSYEYTFYMGLIDNCIDATWAAWEMHDGEHESGRELVKGVVLEAHYISTASVFLFIAKAYARYHNIYPEPPCFNGRRGNNVHISE